VLCFGRLDALTVVVQATSEFGQAGLRDIAVEPGRLSRSHDHAWQIRRPGQRVGIADEYWAFRVKSCLAEKVGSSLEISGPDDDALR